MRDSEEILNRLDLIQKKQEEHSLALGEVKTQLSSLVGNHQPGRVKELEVKVSSLEKFKERGSVYLTLIGAGLGFVFIRILYEFIRGWIS